MIEGYKQKRSPSDRDFRYETKLPPINNSDFNSDTNHHVEELKSGQNNILVAVRARPLNTKENNFSNFETIRVLDGRVVILLDPSNQFESNDIFRGNRNKEQQYAFDFAFDHTVETETIFEKTTKFLIPGVLGGFNATVFAYGATGAGKTYTMLGGQGKPGIMYLTMMELFHQIQNNASDKEFIVKVSYMEVYNETLRDLLSAGDQLMEIREDAAKGVVVSGVKEVIAHNPGDVMDILNVGSKNRTMEATGANVVSSRSHAVLQVTVERRDRNQGISEEISQSKLSLIDLAGSERASNTNNTGQRLIEGANINRSLLALGNCITLLSEKHEKGLKNVHIPYRDSKLTRLLKDSLGGNCRTVMITNVSPAVTVFEDTYNTLKYANRAKNIKTSITRNVLQVENHVEKYAQIINDLKTENDHLKKLLHNNHLKSPDVSTFEESAGLDHKQALINDIRQHFDEEAQMKKKIFDAELQMDDIEEKIIDVQGAEDKINKARYDDLTNSRKRQMLKVEEIKRDFGYMTGKRNQLQARVQKEKNKDTMALLNSVFLQSKMFIDNMDLQQKERRVNNQMRLKDKELRYLQNQLHIKESGVSKSLEVSNVHYLHTPTRSNMTNLNSDLFNQNEFIDESLSFLTELNEIDSRNRTGPVFNNAKQALHIPNVNPKVMYVSPNPASKRVLPPIKKLNIASHNDYGDPPVPASFHSRQPSQYYYKKQEFMVERTKPFEINQSDRPIKKKKAYVPFQTRMKNEILTTARRIEGSLDRETEPKPKQLRNWQLTVPGQGSVKSLNDLSHISNSSNGDGKIKNLRAISKTRVVGRYGNVALRYGASPYVGGGVKSRRK